MKKGVEIGDLPERYQKQIRDKLSVPAANMEQSIGAPSVPAEEVARFDRQVGISVHSKRYRLTDSDGACAKYLIDAIVTAGLLTDDSPQYVKEVKKTQEKISRKEQEETVVTIEVCNG